jgi:phosphoribosyl-AMP cyclohydrolase
MIRDFRSEDAEAVAELSNENHESFQFKDINPDFIRRFVSHPEFKLFVLELSGAVCGFCGVNYRDMGFPELGPLCIEKSLRKTGHAKELVAHTLASLNSISLNPKGIRVRVKASNTDAISFFKSLGFIYTTSIRVAGEPAVILLKPMDSKKIWADLKKRKIDGKELIIAVVQDSKTKEVLMTAFQDETALARTLETGFMHYFSTSRGKLWKKGEESGNTQKLIEVRKDCDADALLYLVEQKKASCHEGYYSCFYKDLSDKVVGRKVFDPKEVY